MDPGLSGISGSGGRRIRGDMEARNIFEPVPENLEEEAIDLLVQRENVRIERIISRGHASPESGWYDQERDEWVMVLKGEAVISLENGEEVHLEAGGYMNIPAHTRHRVKWTHPETETVWLAVHY